MKKFASLTVLSLLVLSLAACATTGSKSANTKVKCPACGYQFEVPAERP